MGVLYCARTLAFAAVLLAPLAGLGTDSPMSGGANMLSEIRKYKVGMVLAHSFAKNLNGSPIVVNDFSPLKTD